MIYSGGDGKSWEKRKEEMIIAKRLAAHKKSCARTKAKRKPRAKRLKRKK